MARRRELWAHKALVAAMVTRDTQAIEAARRELRAALEHLIAVTAKMGGL
jgi:hypothetical protein